MKVLISSPLYLLLVASTSLFVSACSAAPPSIVTAESRLTPTSVSGEPLPQTAVALSDCTPTPGDELSPTYKPDAPIRSTVGKGHILTGTVRSSKDCAPIANVKLELWSEEPGTGHPDEYRATVFTDENGVYRFECNPTDHIHMRISAEGYEGIVSNAYHTEGRPKGVFDIVLKPADP